MEGFGIDPPGEVERFMPQTQAEGERFGTHPSSNLEWFEAQTVCMG